jgi:hypothetical protein
MYDAAGLVITSVRLSTETVRSGVLPTALGNTPPMMTRKVKVPGFGAM